MDIAFYLDKIVKEWNEVDEQGCPSYLQMAIISVTDVARHEGYDGVNFCDVFKVFDSLANLLAERLPGHQINLTHNQIICVYNKDIE